MVLAYHFVLMFIEGVKKFQSLNIHGLEESKSKKVRYFKNMLYNFQK